MSDAPKQQLALNITLPADYSEDNFIIAPCNTEAYMWLMQWPSWPTHVVSVYGEQGCGKSHLANIWQQKCGAKLITSKTMGHFHPADIVQQSKAFLIDMQPEKIAEDWLFHFYNHLKDSRGYLLICSRMPPGQWPIQLPDLRSRLRSIFCLPVLPPDDRAISKILTKSLQEKGIEVKKDIITFLVNRCQRSFSGIYRLAQAIDCFTLEHKRPLTMSVARSVLELLDRSE